MQSFTDLGISAPILQAITDLGFEKPSPIQAEALPILLAGPVDFLGLAATGTGKTAAFGIPLCERIDPARKGVQALVLCPTRELALQVSGQIALLGKHKGIKTQAVYGGSSFGDQVYGLKRGAHVVVGTPGRLVDHLERGTLSLAGVETVILDEADEMISMGFKDDLDRILSGVPEGQSCTWLFSATMGREVSHLVSDYLKDPRKVQINRTEVLSESVEQIYFATHESNKPEVLCKLIDAAEDFYGLVFFQTKALVVDLTEYLRSRGYPVDCLHGDMDQNARERAMKAFRDRRTTVLLCTDVASRGLDVKDVTHVVNYSLPRELDAYVHRIGRTARSGKSGLAYSLVTPSHRGILFRIEKMTKSRIREGKIPTRKDIGAKKVAKALETFQGQANFARAVELLGKPWRDALAAMPPEEIAGRFLALLHPDIFLEREAEPVAPKPTQAARSTTLRVGPAAKVVPGAAPRMAIGSAAAPAAPGFSEPRPERREAREGFQKPFRSDRRPEGGRERRGFGGGHYGAPRERDARWGKQGTKPWSWKAGNGGAEAAGGATVGGKSFASRLPRGNPS